MILNEFYFLIVALFIPNISTLSTMQMNPLSIISNSSAIFLMLVFLGVLILGIYLRKENITSLKDFNRE
jgi:predicted transporter